MKPVRIVLDTNVLVSAVIGAPSAAPGTHSPPGSSAGSPPGRLLELVREHRLVLVTSPPLLAELARVLERPRLRRFIGAGDAALLLATIDTVAEIVAEPLPLVDASPDPDDNAVLATAVAGAAELIVSGDRRGLLDLGSFRGIPIRSPGDALRSLAS